MRSQVRPAGVVLAVACMLCVAGAGAGIVPGDATSTNGASVGAGVGNGVDVTVTNPRAIVDWKTLDTDTGQLLRFLGSDGFAVLNRVNDVKETNFLGNISGPGGHIIIVNPHGIVFGPQSLVEASKFTASTLGIDQAKFLVDDYTFVKNAEIAGEVINQGTIHVGEQAALLAQRVINKGTILCDNGPILMATGDKIVLGNQGSDILVEITGIVPATPPAFQEMGDVINEGTLQSDNGDIILAAGDAFAQALAPQGVGRVEHSGDIVAGGDLRVGSIEETVFLAGNTTSVDGSVKVKGGSAITVEENLTSGEDMILRSGGLVKTRFGSDLVSGGAMEVKSGPTKGISLSGKAESGGDMSLDAGTFISAAGDIVSGGKMTIKTGSGPYDNTFASGNLSSAGDMDLMTNLELSGGKWHEDTESGWLRWTGQSVEAGGKLTAEGWISKITAGELYLTGGAEGLSVDLQSTVTSGGNMYIRGKGDVQVGDELNATEPGFMPPWPTGVEALVLWPNNIGGVSVISEEGRIYTGESDALAVNIFGFSDEVMGVWYSEVPQEPAGVDLPYMDEEGNAQGKAAIVLQSRDTLILSEDAALVASGFYLPAGASNGLPPEKQNHYGPEGVDNRPGIDFLAEDGVTITGFQRDEGVPSDVAIYGASTAGDVIVDTPLVFVDEGFPGGGTNGYYNYYYEYDLGPATVVFDAYDTVLMDGFIEGLMWDMEEYGSEFEGAGFRMEVASRKTEWLNEAIANGTLPFASEPGVMEELLGEDYDYELRGADAPENADGKRAWVLKDQPPFAGVAPLADPEYPQLKGCPVELQSVANELDITREKLQMSINASLAMNPNVQACDACARVMRAAAILKDVDGSYLAALNQVFGQLAPADAPFTPEAAASVVVAFAELSNERPEYALAATYVDAFVDYVAVLDGELGKPVGDSVAFVIEKHGGSLMQDANANVSAFVTARLAEIGG